MSPCKNSGRFLYLLITIYLIPGTDAQATPTCPPPPGIANGRVRHSGPYYPGDEVVYDCDRGYGLTEPNGRSVCRHNATIPETKYIPAVSAVCTPPPPTDNRREINNFYEGLPEWLGILAAVFLGLMLLMLLTCLVAAIWSLCCGRAGGGSCFGMAGSSSSSNSNMTSSSHTYNTTSTSNHVTPPKTIPTQDAGTQVRLHQSGGDYYNDYPQKHATYTKVEYTKQTQGEAPSTTGNKEPVWMPHAKPPRNDIYHAKSITK